jgi:hypothetical protein
MTTDEAVLASERQDNDDYERHLAAEIVAMLPYIRTEALKVLALVHEILRLTPEPQPSEPQLPDDASGPTSVP